MKFKVLFSSCTLLCSMIAFSQLPQSKDISKNMSMPGNPPTNGSVYKIKNTASGRYLQTLNASTENGATIHLMDNRNDDHYKWKAISGKSGHFKFQNVKSGKYLAVMGASKDIYGILCQWDDAGQDDILWKPEKSGSSFKLRNFHSKLMAAVEGAGKANSAKLIQWNDDGGADKLFTFELVKSEQPDDTRPVTTGKKILVDVILNNIGVSESTRNRIDNGDCKRVFGTVKTELWEIDADNNMVAKLAPYNQMTEAIFSQLDYKSPAPVAYSYHQERGSTIEMGKVTYNIPEELLKQKRVMVVVRTNIGSRHKDNDFATYDALRMEKEKETSFLLDGSIVTGRKTDKTIQVNTDLNASGRAMHVQDIIIPFSVFQRTDDTHNLWLNLSVIKK